MMMITHRMHLNDCACMFLVLCSVMGMHLFGGKYYYETQHGEVIVERKNFDTLLWAMVTVFQVSF